MRLTSYIHADRSWNAPTGVGKHINNMCLNLAATPGVALTVASARTGLTPAGTMPPGAPLESLPLAVVPFQRKTIERCWTLLNLPAADRWLPPSDFVYCPGEAYVPLKRSRLAVTLHCVNWLEADLPWSNDPGNLAIRRRWNWMYRRIRADRRAVILTVSEFLKSRITALIGIAAARIHVVGNGVEEAYFAAEPNAANLPPRIAALDPYVLVIGGLTQRKGGGVVIEVARELARLDSPVRIAVASSYNDPQYEPAFAELPNLINVGYLSVTAGLPAALARSVALLFPSRYETFGIPAIEAMAAGTPAIVSNYAAFPEVTGDAGLVHDSANPAAIARTIESLRTDPAYRQSVIARGRAHARQHTWQACTQRLLAALRST